MQVILLFVLLQFINVILSTIKSVLTIKSNRIVASVSSAIYFGFYTIVVIWTAADNMNIWIKVAIAAVTNLTGTYIAKYILDKAKRERLWDITAAVKSTVLDNVCSELNEHCLLHTRIEMNNPKYWLIHTYAKGKEESREIRRILDKYDAYVIVHEQDAKL